MSVVLNRPGLYYGKWSHFVPIMYQLNQWLSLKLACIVEAGGSLPSSCHPTSSAKSRPPQKKNVVVGKVLNPRYRVLFTTYSNCCSVVIYEEMLVCGHTCEIITSVYATSFL